MISRTIHLINCPGFEGKNLHFLLYFYNYFDLNNNKIGDFFIKTSTNILSM